MLPRLMVEPGVAVGVAIALMVSRAGSGETPGLEPRNEDDR